MSLSPLRYPGGKSRFQKFIVESMDVAKIDSDIFVEPFCGGSAVSIALLKSKKVKKIALNDCDPLVASFWKIVFGKSSKPKQDITWLTGMIESTEVTLDEWHKQKAIVPNNMRESAWKCLYLNRTSFNGIIHKAGPIGGKNQDKNKIDVRFNREGLIEKINILYGMKSCVDRVTCEDWQMTCDHYKNLSNSFLYLDPPYYQKAEALYGYVFDNKKHKMMRDYLISLKTPWMLSYDDTSEIRLLYSKCPGIDGRVIDQTYSAHPVGGASIIGRELFFSNHCLAKSKNKDENQLHTGITILGKISKVKPVPVNRRLINPQKTAGIKE
jgi:DNA adenine methylase